MVDQRFHLGLHLLAVGENNLRSIGFDGPGWHSFERLLHDSDRLAQFPDAAHVAIEYVAFFTERHLELEILVSRVRRVPPQVDIYPAAAQGGPAGAERNRVFGGNLGYALGPQLPDGIAGKQTFVLIDTRGEAIGKFLYPIEEIERRIEGDAPHPEVRRHHAL